MTLSVDEKRRLKALRDDLAVFEWRCHRANPKPDDVTMRDQLAAELAREADNLVVEELGRAICLAAAEEHNSAVEDRRRLENSP